MTQASFRFIVLVAVGTGILAGTLDLFAPGLIPASVVDAYDAYFETEDAAWSSTISVGVLALILLVGGIAGVVGLLLFKKWGRSVCLVFTVVSVLICPLFGPMLSSSWAVMLGETSTMLWGAALAMAYFSDLKTKFEADFANKPLQPIARGNARSG